MKNDIIQSLAKHLEAVAGISPKLASAPEVLQRLPMYFGSLYEPWKGDLPGQGYILLVAKGNERSTPAKVAGHYRVAMRELKEPVAFVFADLESFARHRLVQYRVPFIVPRRQVYLPQFLVDLREGASAGNRQGPKDIQHLSGAAQALLLFYLQKPAAPPHQSLREWATLLNYSAMTATRIASELVEMQLCAVEQQGRKTLIHFQGERRALWEKALPFLRTPVRGRSHVRFTGNPDPSWLQAGIPALCHHTMLADDGHAVVAMNTSAYARALLDAQIQKLPFADEDAATVERWRYRPETLSTGPTVDRLSLYLSLRDDPDERVQGCLKDLLEDIKW